MHIEYPCKVTLTYSANILIINAPTLNAKTVETEKESISITLFYLQ